MLIKLAKKDTELYPDDEQKRKIIYNRYKKYEIPVRYFYKFNLFKFVKNYYYIVSWNKQNGLVCIHGKRLKNKKKYACLTGAKCIVRI